MKDCDDACAFFWLIGVIALSAAVAVLALHLLGKF